MSRVSIVTATYNRLGMLQDAVASVRTQAQSVGAIEHLIVDGGSRDGTIEWVARQSDLKLIVGPDYGVYDAWNKALAVADGEVVGFLNSDDLYCPDAIEKALAKLAQEPAVDAVAGAAMLVEDDTVVRRYDQPKDFVGNLRTFFLGHCGINNHFFRRRCFDDLTGFSLRYSLTSDRDFMLRFVDRGMKAAPIDGYVYRYRRHDGSLTFDRDLKNAWELRLELLDLARKWQEDNGASLAARRLARVLEGRCWVGLVRLALRQRDQTMLKDTVRRSFASRGLLITSVVAMGLDYVVHGR